ncbi:unnamed protein product [Leptidea sinapis]|uniref:Outer dense fiber protein 3 n=1 Tax=Leptidea sinapis TaxID=189913 RepID=A0A5E4PPX0_9NEOP|nr:unnamed protein product [Leptidea sinapis]
MSKKPLGPRPVSEPQPDVLVRHQRGRALQAVGPRTGLPGGLRHTGRRRVVAGLELRGERSTMRTPGPGAHAPEKCPPTRDPRAPAYSMGARLGFALKRPGPAPNAYALQMGPGSPAYTMGARVGFSLKPKSPGPAVYFQQDADVYCARAPVYSMGARSAGAGKPTKSPGPAAYPPDLYNTKKNPYKYSFGTKHGDYAPPMIIKEDTMDCL